MHKNWMHKGVVLTAAQEAALDHADAERQQRYDAAFVPTRRH
jgi:hypothetical protein